MLIDHDSRILFQGEIVIDTSGAAKLSVSVVQIYTYIY